MSSTTAALFVAITAMTACGGHADPELYGQAAWTDRAAPDDAPVAPFARPKLVVIRADWCPFCRSAQPAIDAAYAPFRDRVDLVVLDVSDERTSLEAARIAKAEGVSVFFERWKGRTPTLGVFLAPDAGRRVPGNLEDPDRLSEELRYAIQEFPSPR